MPKLLPGEVCLANTARLHLSDGHSTVYGANQSWYPTHWQRLAGCGPTVGSHLAWFLAGTRPQSRALAPCESLDRSAMLRLMLDMFGYITPGIKGVNTPEIFSQGIERYARERSVALSCETLHIPKKPELRPDRGVVAEFLLRALEMQLPIAFLNLSNGAVKNLESWHWVTLVSFHSESFTALMYDQCERSRIDLGLWLDTTSNGGGFVVAIPQPQY